MLSGFNTNIRHRDVLFHVQSEDSGRSHPHIITHLYHGGTILASEKSSYAERLEEEDLTLVVKELMECQHKAVLKRLVGGDFDGLILDRLGDDVFDGAPARPPGSVTQPEVAPPAAAPQEVPAEAPDLSQAPTRSDAPGEAPRAFGEGIVSEKPLDEVILHYLVENARKRRRS